MPNATFRAYWIVRNARTMTTDRLMMRLKLAPMGSSPRVTAVGRDRYSATTAIALISMR